MNMMNKIVINELFCYNKKKKEVLVMKKIFMILLSLFFFTPFSSVFAEEVEITGRVYQLDVTDHYALASSIKDVLETISYDDNDLQKFFLILKEIEEKSIILADDLLKKYDVVYEPTDYTPRYMPSVSWRYLETINPYYPGFNHEYETKQLVANFTLLETKFVRAGTIETFGLTQCITGWILLNHLGSAVVCAKYGSTTGYYPTTTVERVESRYFVRYYSDDIDQSIYGFSNHYRPKFQFQYQRVASSSKVLMTLIDNDKLIIELFQYGELRDSFYITKNTHHKRNELQVIFPVTEQEFKSDYYSLYGCSQKFAYFHQLATFSGDTFHLRNKKYVCKLETSFIDPELKDAFPLAASEVVYSHKGTLVTHHVNFGTFNFSTNTEEHYMMDVYPYLIWGNSPYDSTTLRERLIWDYDSRRINFFESLQKWRGLTLITRLTARIHPSLSSEELGGYFATFNHLFVRLNWYYGGYSGVIPVGTSRCGDVYSPNCVDLLPY
jgi:hypothetical protein